MRGLLMALPFAVWFLWSWRAKASGRPMGSTPWPWLLGAGAVLVGLSLMATAVFHTDNRGETYVPGEVAADGSVTEPHFDPPAKKVR